MWKKVHLVYFDNDLWSKSSIIINFCTSVLWFDIVRRSYKNTLLVFSLFNLRLTPFGNHATLRLPDLSHDNFAVSAKILRFVKTKRIDGSPNRCTFETRDPKSMIIPLRGNFSHSRHRVLDGIEVTAIFGWCVAVKAVVFRILGLRGGMWNRHGMFNLNLVTVSEMR